MSNQSFLSNDPSYIGIKICGLQDEECVDVAIAAGANAIGFVFVDSSPRCVSREIASQLLTQLPDDVIPVAVLQDSDCLHEFVNWKGWLQLCGNENEEVIASLHQPVIKAIQWNFDEMLRWDACEHIAAMLIDGSSGGEGTTFDVESLAKLIPTLKTPVIIAGGLSSSNVLEVIQKASPHAVDVSSGVEIERGVKNPERICEFINAARNENS